MDLIAVVANHGYLVTAVVLFLAAVGMPLPVAICLLTAGAASRQGLNPAAVFAIGWASALAGDLLLYLGGTIHRLVAAGRNLPALDQS